MALEQGGNIAAAGFIGDLQTDGSGAEKYYESKE
jgi:hypothetical protein